MSGYIAYNTVTSKIIAMATGSSPDPVGYLSLTATEMQAAPEGDPTYYIVSGNPATVSVNPNFWAQRGPYYMARQIGRVQAGFQAALTAPFAFTNAAGVASSYAMDATSQFIYSQAYANYVLGGEALPAGFTIRDVNGTPQTFTVADIKGLYTGIVNFVQSCNAAFNNFVGQIKASTSYSACVAIVWSTP